MQPALAREPDAFRPLMREHNQALFRTARAILRDDAEAEEHTHERRAEKAAYLEEKLEERAESEERVEDSP